MNACDTCGKKQTQNCPLIRAQTDTAKAQIALHILKGIMDVGSCPQWDLGMDVEKARYSDVLRASNRDLFEVALFEL